MKAVIHLSQLLAGMAEFAPPTAELPVAGLALDSRRLQAGDVFIALAGSRCHGLVHAEAAVQRGAVAIIYDPAADGSSLIQAFTARLPCVPVAGLGARLGVIADRFYGQPSRRLAVIGVTGTNGKSSCTHYIAEALGDALPCAVMGTLGWGMPGALTATANTTPDALTLHGAMAQLADQGVKALALEVSSHGLHQGRVNGVHFKGAVFTNLSRDHLDYHGDMQAYLAAKLTLLRAPGLEFVVANRDDPSFDAVRAAVPQGVRLLAFSATGQGSGEGEVLSAHDIQQDTAGLAFSVHSQGGAAQVKAPLFGRFNVDNLLAGLAVLLALGYELPQAAERLTAVRAVPGRMERFSAASGDFSVIVDYAHSPHALESVLHSLRAHCRGRLWCVFGCGGDRDKGKRPEMGRIAMRLADRVVITDDNPRHEDGGAIVADILAGCYDEHSPPASGLQPPAVERDRRAAIALAIKQAQPGDVILVAGKGHEAMQEVAGISTPFSDRCVVQQLLARADTVQNLRVEMA
ncbi:MAG: UDP-N-acetylmuramoyl-L-alanyl-D-glutamate--2,6-diaminopimelate ligase [Methylococcaceae bacterium]|nr:MAG: UDP-N-acetylmuramoyl-L-alanyl-D-glutamate--2,6-diaminopimelate ligase [Methylococcaceae bacterium]